MQNKPIPIDDDEVIDGRLLDKDVVNNERTKPYKRLQMFMTREDALDIRNFLSLSKVKKLIPKTGYVRFMSDDLTHVLNKEQK